MSAARDDLDGSGGISDVTLSGWLERKGLRLGRWARRFYVLRDTFLFVSHQEPGSLLEGIARPDHVIWLHTPGAEVRISSQQQKGKQFIFSVCVNEPAKEEHILAASSEEERAEWVRCIGDSMRMAEAEAAEQQQGVSHSTSRVISRDTSPSRSGLSRSSSQTNGAHASRSLLRSPSHLRAVADSPPTSPMQQQYSGARSQHGHAAASGSFLLGSGASPAAAASPLSSDDATPGSDQRRLDQFTQRTRSNILLADGAELEEDGRDTYGSPSDGQAADVGESEGEEVGAEGDAAAVPASPHSRQRHSRHSSALHARASPPLTPRSPAPLHPPVPVSAIDDDTRLKLRQIEASGSDPELVALLAEQQLVLDKIAKLKMHKKVLSDEIKAITPKCTVQAKVNAQYVEEIQLHKALQSKRTAHRIQVCKWAESIQSRLARSEPAAFLKQQRKLQAQQMRQQQQQQQNSLLHSPSFTNGAPPSAHHLHPRQHHLLPAHPANPYSNYPSHLPSSSSFSPDHGYGADPHPAIRSASFSSASSLAYAPSPVTLTHSDVLRLSNAELDAVEREVRARIPSDPVSEELLTELQREEQLYEEVDANRAVVSLEQLEAIARRSRAPSTPVTPGIISPGLPAPADAYTVLLQSHTRHLHDLAHMATGALLREVAVRRQINLLQEAIYKLTSEKENKFRHEYQANLQATTGRR